ncbi:MAG: competence protein CoiA family protein [Anaerolineaceae bacterium]|nr:competence protein CoiA family protein [Anaerolineaceae bacterium]
MPFIAINKVTRERIDITTIENPRLALENGVFLCQLCGQPMFIRGGGYYIHHFCHKVSCHSDEYGTRERETPEHLFGKREIAKLLHEQFNGQNVKIEYEVPLPEIKRVADILVTYPMGWRLAHEIQLSDITKDEIDIRTSDYESIGIDVVWWLGERIRNEVRNWSIERFGRVFTVKVSRTTQDQSISLPKFS